MTHWLVLSSEVVVVMRGELKVDLGNLELVFLDPAHIHMVIVV